MPKAGIGTIPVRARTLDDANVMIDDETYNIVDLELFDSQGVVRHTVSKTILHPTKSTRGHHHQDSEVYYFIDGSGIIMIENNPVMVSAGDFILVESNKHHQVINYNKETNLTFLCFFGNKMARPPFFK